MVPSKSSLVWGGVSDALAYIAANAGVGGAGREGEGRGGSVCTLGPPPRYVLLAVELRSPNVLYVCYHFEVHLLYTAIRE